jgi:hypothetical protein
LLFCLRAVGYFLGQNGAQSSQKPKGVIRRLNNHLFGYSFCKVFKKKAG